MRVPADNANGVQVHWCDRRKRAGAPEINTKKRNVQSEPQLGLFPTLGVDCQAHPEQVHRTDPHEYDRLMGIGSLSSSIGRLPGIQGPTIVPTPVPSVTSVGCQEGRPINTASSSGADEVPKR